MIGEVEEGPPADFTILANHRLVAYVWKKEDGAFRHAGAGAAQTAVPFADVLCYDAGRAELLLQLIARASDLDAFRFAVELEGLQWLSGAAAPHARMRRF
jgi:hypothetical protein